MAWRKAPKRNYFLYGIAGFVLLYVGFIALRALHTSAVFARHDRINIAFYGDEATILSFGLTDNVNYIVSLSHEQKIMIPGGYNQYPMGSLGKLVEIEKDPDILQRAFSSMISAYVNYYVSPKRAEVFQKPDTDQPAYQKVDLIRRLFSSSNLTNMNVIDKIYIGYLIAKRRQQDYVVLRSSIRRDEEDGAHIFSEKSFLKKYKGFFYYQTLREEGMETQIKYNNYKSAVTLSRVIEGQGIRVADLSASDRNVSRCIIRTRAPRTSKTVDFIARSFSCDIETGETEGVDIIVYLGEEIESQWE